MYFIYLNFQASRYTELFPHLKILKIRLNEHNLFDFLRKLDKQFCEQIEELWLDTKNIIPNQEYEHEHERDMTSNFTKFKNLTSLNLVPSLAKFDPKQSEN